MKIKNWSNVLPFFLLQKLVCEVERQEELWGESKGTPLLWETQFLCFCFVFQCNRSTTFCFIKGTVWRLPCFSKRAMSFFNFFILVKDSQYWLKSFKFILFFIILRILGESVPTIQSLKRVNTIWLHIISLKN
jgi:hypothetical protein